MNVNTLLIHYTLIQSATKRKIELIERIDINSDDVKHWYFVTSSRAKKYTLKTTKVKNIGFLHYIEWSYAHFKYHYRYSCCEVYGDEEGRDKTG